MRVDVGKVFPVLAPTSLPWAMARRYALSSCEAVC
ncbi:Uncharacterised protein [Mycobacterium tuberculosis]|nr:Uncharacterised protein [Mycobacterium tuberculosis]